MLPQIYQCTQVFGPFSRFDTEILSLPFPFASQMSVSPRTWNRFKG